MSIDHSHDWCDIGEYKGRVPGQLFLWILQSKKPNLEWQQALDMSVEFVLSGTFSALYPANTFNRFPVSWRDNNSILMSQKF